MVIPEVADSEIVPTSVQRGHAPEIADQAIGYLLSFTRGLSRFIRAQPAREWRLLRPGVVLDELKGPALLVIGLSGIDSEMARRAHAFGMRVLAADPKVLERPLYVEELHRPEAFASLFPRADVDAGAVPLTRPSRGAIAARDLALMKRGVVLTNVSRGKVVDSAALVPALDCGRVAGAGLDVTDSEPLPKGHPLWSRDVINTPHSVRQSGFVCSSSLSG